jgi:DNA polymerase III epsilon subunit family exonuclease
VPENLFDIANTQIGEITKGVEEAYSTALNIAVKLKKNHFDEYFFALDIIKVINSHASLRGCITEEAITFEKTDGKIIVKIILKESVHSLFIERGMLADLNEFIYSNYCDDISAQIILSPEKEEFVEDKADTYAYDDPSGRFIDAKEVEVFVGFPITAKPGYISDGIKLENIADDTRNHAPSMVFCGRITEISEHTPKPKDDGKERKNYYRFTVEDPTGQVKCVYFPTEKTRDKMKILTANTEVVVQGELNSFNNAISLRVKNISYCTMPKDFKENRLKFKPLAKYRFIKPQSYTNFSQGSLLDSAPSATAKFLKNKEFIIFDLETTGLNRLLDHIIEIGAVKIKDGVIVETFSSLIDPQVPLSEKITKLTGLKDSDLKGANLINEVLPDFLKFCGDAAIVGHNIEQFDFPFLSAAGSRHHIYFDNPRLDTMDLAKKHLSASLKNFALSDLAKFYEIKNDSPHRGMGDAMTTAKIFMQLAEKINE